MAGDLPPGFGEGSTSHPPTAGQWAPAYPTQPAPRTRIWPAIALAAIATVVAVAALILALTHSATPRPTTSPTYNAQETTAAHEQLCDMYSRAARAVQIESNGGGTALARIATVNGALMLEAAAAVPALGPDDRSAALALARTYRDLTAVGSVAQGSSDPAWQSAVADVNAKDAAMKGVCHVS
jgi:hypothetical protein